MASIVAQPGTEAPKKESQASIRVEALSPARFSEACSFNNAFTREGCRKRCFCLIPCALCPDAPAAFSHLYRTCPELLKFSALAIDESTDNAVGFIQMSAYGLPRSPWNRYMHRLQPGECYIEQASVSPRARGKGIGTKLLRYCEDIAREEGYTMLSLGVVRNNPAQRLYERFGFEVDSRNCCDGCIVNLKIFCILGCPHWSCGAVTMTKMISTVES